MILKANDTLKKKTHILKLRVNSQTTMEVQSDILEYGAKKMISAGK